MRLPLSYRAPHSVSIAQDASSSWFLRVWVGVLLALFVVLAPTVNVFQAEELYNSKRLFQLAVLVGIYGWLLVHAPTRSIWVNTYLSLPRLIRLGYVSVVLLGVVSAVSAPLPHFGLLEVSFFVLLLGIAILVAAWYRRHPDVSDRLVLSIIILGVSLYAVRFLVSYGAHIASDVPLWPRGGTGFANIRFFNQFQTWTLPLLVVPMLMRRSSNALAYAGIAVAVLWWCLIIASGGRGTTLGMLCACAGVALVFRTSAWPWLRIQIGALCAGLVLYVLLFIVFGHAEHTLFQRSFALDSARLLLWKDALSLAWTEPWLGVGPMHYAYYHPIGRHAHPHNALVQLVAEWGIPATLVLLSLIGWGALRWVQGCLREQRSVVRSHRKTAVRIGITGSLLAGAAHALVSGVVVMPVSQMLAVVVIGWAIGVHMQHHVQPRSTPRAHSVAILLILVAGAALAWGTHGDIGYEAQVERAEVYGDKPALYPRFWQIGYIW